MTFHMFGSLTATSQSQANNTGWEVFFSRQEFDMNKYELYLEIRACGHAFLNNVLSTISKFCRSIKLDKVDIFAETFGNKTIEDIVSALTATHTMPFFFSLLSQFSLL